MFDTLGGLPLHTIVVHATVVAVPVTAIVVLLAGLWPKFRRWAGVLPLLLALLSVVLVPVSTQSGEKLEGRVGESDLVEKHAELGDGLLVWVLGVAVVALAITWVWWNERAARVTSATAGTDAASTPHAHAATPRVPGGRATAIALAVAAVVVSVGTGVQVVRIGHSGAEAVWKSTIDNTQPSSGDDD